MILAFAAVVEIGTGLGLAVAPALVVSLLIGTELSGLALALGRCFGIALIALGLACWPSPQRVEGSSPASRAMLTHNSLIAFYLAFLGMVEGIHGLLLWPAVALLAAVALLLVRTGHGARRPTSPFR
jgi:Ca2+/Na+ antiporter